MKYLSEEGFEERIKSACDLFYKSIPGNPSYDTEIIVGLYPNASICGFSNKNGHAEMIYNRETKEPYELIIHNPNTEQLSYYWVHPHFHTAREDEIGGKGLLVSHASEPGNNWGVTDTIDDICEKITAILEGKEFDSRVVAVFEITEETQAHLNQIAEARGISVDEAMEYVLQLAIDSLESTDDESSDT